MDNESRNDRRDFIKTSVLTSAAVVLGPTVMASGAVAQTKGKKQQSGGSKTGSEILTKQRILGSGKNTLKVSEIGLGTMGMVTGRGRFPDRKMSIQLIRQAYDRGVTFFDTAEGYGPYVGEELLGEAVKPFRNNVVITSKFSGRYENGRQVRDNNPARIKQACEASLKRLGVEAIDLYYMHRNDHKTPMEDVAGAVKDLIKEGKVKHFGMCEVGEETIRKAHAVQPVTAIQSEYSLMFRKPEEVVFPTMKELGIGFVPYSPIGRGFLGGNITEYSKFDPAHDSRGSSPRFTPEAIRANLKFVEVLHEFGRTRGMTSAQLSLAWMLAKYPFIVPLPGTTKLAHLEEDLRAANFPFGASDVAELEQALAPIKIVGERYSGVNARDAEY